jgi:hypothetical protein
MHSHFRQFMQYFWYILKFGPIELDILACSEMTEAAIISTGNVRQFRKLFATQLAIGNGDPEHMGMALLVQTIPQSQLRKILALEGTG